MVRQAGFEPATYGLEGQRYLFNFNMLHITLPIIYHGLLKKSLKYPETGSSMIQNFLVSGVP